MRILLPLLLILLLIPLSALAAPDVSPEALIYDFGQVAQGEKVKHSFRFRNSGDELLELSSVSSSCGCTAALLSSRRISPGEMGEIEATFDSSRFRGRVSKSIMLKTNAPDHPQLTFKLQGEVKELLSLSTARISWEWSAVGEVRHAEVVINNYSQQTIQLQEPRATSPQLVAELDRLQLPPGEDAILSLSGTLAAGEERLNAYLLIATDFSPMPQLRLSVSGRLK